MNSLSEDSLSHILSYLDFESAVKWKERISKKWRRQLSSTESGSIPHVWKNLFYRSAYASEDLQLEKIGPSEERVNCLIQQYKYRKRLQKALFNRAPRHRFTPASRHASTTLPSARPIHCFHLPNRLFSFLPVIPDSWDEDEFFDWDDPPPVNFRCDSFMLTSTAVGAELLLLNPFSKTLSIYSSVLDNVIHSDEGMMEQALNEAGILIASARKRCDFDSLTDASRDLAASFFLGGSPNSVAHDGFLAHDDELELAAMAINDRVHRNHSLYKKDYRVTPKYTLISLEDTILDIDLMEYFWDHAPHRQRAHQFMVEDEENADGVEVEIDYMGIEAKPVLGQDGLPTGMTMLAVGRAMQSERNQNDLQLECFEAIAWFRSAGEDDSFCHKKSVCRVRGDCMSVDLCATERRVYINPTAFTRRNLEEMPFDAALQEWARQCGTSKVYVYPLVEYSAKSGDNEREAGYPSKYFPEPFMILDCKHPVSTLAVCASGKNLVVATSSGLLLWWEVYGSSSQLIHEIKLSKVLQKLIRSRSLSPGLREIATSCIVSFHCPRAMPMQMCGFCTLHRSAANNSCSVLMWHHVRHDEGYDELLPQTMINLPLYTQKTPQIHYDGRRLIVFGQDHIGLIILVYEVFSTLEHLALVPTESTSDLRNQRFSGQLDGGVYDLTPPGASPRVRFVNRIRHAALGGIHDFESLRMTCNERFIVVNTKTGNLLSDGTVPFQEGLLVIDLDDQKHYC